MKARTLAQLLKQVKHVQQQPLEFTIVDPETLPEFLQVQLSGQEGTPYEQGIFMIRLQFPSDFPKSAPSGYFATKIFHPNVAPLTGEICVNVLKKDWNKNC